jgi:hypothetical protein
MFSHGTTIPSEILKWEEENSGELMYVIDK